MQTTKQDVSRLAIQLTSLLTCQKAVKISSEISEKSKDFNYKYTIELVFLVSKLAVEMQFTHSGSKYFIDVYNIFTRCDDRMKKLRLEGGQSEQKIIDECITDIIEIRNISNKMYNKHILYTIFCQLVESCCKLIEESINKKDFIKEIEEIPVYFDMHTTMSVYEKTPEEIIDTLYNIFSNDYRIEFKVSNVRYQINGKVHFGDSPFYFRITIFKEKEEKGDNGYKLEFSKMSGCSVDFYDFYKQCCLYISNSSKCTNSGKNSGTNSGIYNFSIPSSQTQEYQTSYFSLSLTDFFIFLLNYVCMLYFYHYFFEPIIGILEQEFEKFFGTNSTLVVYTLIYFPFILVPLFLVFISLSPESKPIRMFFTKKMSKRLESCEKNIKHSFLEMRENGLRRLLILTEELNNVEVDLGKYNKIIYLLKMSTYRTDKLDILCKTELIRCISHISANICEYTKHTKFFNKIRRNIYKNILPFVIDFLHFCEKYSQKLAETDRQIARLIGVLCTAKNIINLSQDEKTIIMVGIDKRIKLINDMLISSNKPNIECNKLKNLFEETRKNIVL